MASRSHPLPYVSNLDDSDILEVEYRKNLMNMSDVLKEREEKIKQQKQVEKAIKSLSHMLQEKKAFLEKKEGQQMEIDEEIDDIKVLEDVMNMKKFEREQRKREQKALHKAFKAYLRYEYKISEKYCETWEERCNREEEGEAGGDRSE
ncbi:hypothetical protein CAEBREN_03147 [Caenorhabditis brenneri]|uniref:Uncharacterized protein n=1 Tax=Caenorhabditis brenneri TaxID=135651 RepID=G0P0L1_CAEBE|nr:hypothetical protein CAEBREN_03147 [Caenorhabditis brenneri]